MRLYKTTWFLLAKICPCFTCLLCVRAAFKVSIIDSFVHPFLGFMSRSETNHIIHGRLIQSFDAKKVLFQIGSYEKKGLDPTRTSIKHFIHFFVFSPKHEEGE